MPIYYKPEEVVVCPLPHPEHHGDWHDKPLKYVVHGPGTECQKFATKKEANTYRTDRRRSATWLEAHTKWGKRS